MLTGSFFDAKYKAADGVERNTRFNRNYVFNFLIGKEWRVGANKNNLINTNIRLNYLAGNRIENIDLGKSLTQKEVVYGENDGNLAFSQQLPDSPIVSFSFSYTKNKPKHSSVWSLQVVNALGTEEYQKDFFNIKTMNMDTKYTRILVPNISYRVDF